MTEPNRNDDDLRGLFRALREDDSASAPGFAPTRGPRRTRPGRPLVPLLAILAVVVLGVAVAWLRGDAPGEPPSPKVDEVARVDSEPEPSAPVPDPAPEPRPPNVLEPEPIAESRTIPSRPATDEASPAPTTPTAPQPEAVVSSAVEFIVVDDGGQPLPGAEVTLVRRTTDPVRAVADVRGVVRLPGPPAGESFAAFVEAPGFAPQRLDGVVRPGAAGAVLHVQMLSEYTETVLAAAGGSPVALSDADVSTRFSDTFVQDLPVPGRLYTGVLTMPPGVQDGDGDVTVHGSRGRELRTSGGGVEIDALRSLGYAAPGADAVEPPSTESYAPIEPTTFLPVASAPRSTFAVDVDTASYTNVRRFLATGLLPPGDAVRVEELVNYFRYREVAPEPGAAVGIDVEVADCPWNPAHRLARVAVGARPQDRGDVAGSNLVFLIDVSGSMAPANKLPLVRDALRLLVDTLDGRDTVTIVVYAGTSGVVLEPTPGSDRATILEALDRLEARGSTAGADGLELAYRAAVDHIVPGGVNRVILATDGDFNIGPTSHGELLDRIASGAERGVFLTALGFGMGNLKDDRLERLADRGNGQYAYVDGLDEARRLFVEQAGGTLVTVAKDVKIQVEFNPAEVGAYRLVGYENRRLADRDFHDDAKDGGEMGAGHVVTALYELAPPDSAAARVSVEDSLRYARPAEPTEAAASGELMTVGVRYKEPEGQRSRLVERAVLDDGDALEAAGDDLRFAAAVAAFGLKLRDDPAVSAVSWDAIADLASGSIGEDPHGHRAAFVGLVRTAARIADDPDGGAAPGS